MAYDNTNRWTLNKNDRKETERHPDYKGSINVDGVDYWLDGWIKEGANGKFISGSLKRKEARGFSAEPPHQRTDISSIMDDDEVPF